MSVILSWTKAVRELTGSKQCYKDLLEILRDSLQQNIANLFMYRFKFTCVPKYISGPILPCINNRQR